MTPLDNLKSSLKAVGEKYADDFCAGWRHRAFGDSLEYTKQIQDNNNTYRRRTNHPDLVTTGQVDGWNARNEIYPD